MSRIEEHYDILNRAARRGQEPLLSLPRTARKDNPFRQAQIAAVAAKRAEIKKQGEIYTNAKAHPELCPPVGAAVYFRNSYGLKIKVTVAMVMNGLPGTITTLFPIEEQPEHLRDPELLAHYAKLEDIRSNWTRWPDENLWREWQKIREQHLENIRDYASAGKVFKV